MEDRVKNKRREEKHSSVRALPYSAAFLQPVETPASNKTASRCPHMTENYAYLSTSNTTLTLQVYKRMTQDLLTCTSEGVHLPERLLTLFWKIMQLQYVQPSSHTSRSIGTLHGKKNKIKKCLYILNTPALARTAALRLFCNVLVHSSMQNIWSSFIFLGLGMWTFQFNSHHRFSIWFKYSIMSHCITVRLVNHFRVGLEVLFGLS